MVMIAAHRRTKDWQPARRGASEQSLLDQVLPRYDFRGRASIAIHASPERIFLALREVTLADMPLAYALGSIRYSPGLLTGRLKRDSDHLTRPFFAVAGNLVLGEEPNREMVVGRIGRLHNLQDQQAESSGTPACRRLLRGRVQVQHG
jgi:hypothetical protein